MISLALSGTPCWTSIRRACVAKALIRCTALPFGHKPRRALPSRAIGDVGDCCSKRFSTASRHDVADIITAIAVRTGHPTEGLAVAAVQSKGHAQPGAILTAKFEAIRAPAGIAHCHGHPTFVTSRHAGLLVPALQQQDVIAHDR
ncbi:hypothetical protein ACG10_05680 [Azotobacter chroococcum]|nr:hypothetical protein ACG10_05680 [Azotobacter chroococcum]